MKFLDSNNVAEAIAFAIPQLAAKLPADVRQAMAHARDEERGERARIVLDQLCDNCMIAGQNMLPICQDTRHRVGVFGNWSRCQYSWRHLFRSKRCGCSRLYTKCAS